jgi:hypothetical protein
VSALIPLSLGYIYPREGGLKSQPHNTLNADPKGVAGVCKTYTNQRQMASSPKPKTPLKSRVYGRVTASNPSMVWTAGDFSDFGTREAINKALERLAQEGRLRRVAPGFYDRPRLNRLTGKPTATNYQGVINAVARRDKARLLVDGMTAANDLGLSEAVPGRIIVHTDARIRPIQLGNQKIIFRPTAASKLYWAGRPAMRLIQALHWLKPKLNNPHEKSRVIRKLDKLFRDAIHGEKLKADIRQGFRVLPSWMQDFLKELNLDKSQSQ